MFSCKYRIVVALAAVVWGVGTAVCHTPYGGGYPGGCSGGSCPVASPAHATYAPAQQGYAPTSQQSLPSTYGGGGSGSR